MTARPRDSSIIGSVRPLAYPSITVFRERRMMWNCRTVCEAAGDIAQDLGQVCADLRRVWARTTLRWSS